MDQQQAQNINQASEELTDSARQAFQMLADRTVSLQESNLKLTQNFFQNWIEQAAEPDRRQPPGGPDGSGAERAPAAGSADPYPGVHKRLL
jgi:hypothetical protein